MVEMNAVAQTMRNITVPETGDHQNIVANGQALGVGGVGIGMLDIEVGVGGDERVLVRHLDDDKHLIGDLEDPIGIVHLEIAIGQGDQRDTGGGEGVRACGVSDVAAETLGRT